MNSFEELIAELGELLGISLETGDGPSVLLEFEEGGRLYIELQPSETELVMGCDVARIPPGKGREATFRAALMANGISSRAATFAYSRKADKLVLCQALPLYGLTGEQVVASARAMLALSQKWAEATRRGEIPYVAPPVEESQ